MIFDHWSLWCKWGSFKFYKLKKKIKKVSPLKRKEGKMWLEGKKKNSLLKGEGDWRRTNFIYLFIYYYDLEREFGGKNQIILGTFF